MTEPTYIIMICMIGLNVILIFGLYRAIRGIRILERRISDMHKTNKFIQDRFLFASRNNSYAKNPLKRADSENLVDINDYSSS